MTREELFSDFPRPWRLSEEDIGVILCADGAEALAIDPNGNRDEASCTALAELVMEFVNGAAE